MSGDQLNADTDLYGRAAGENVAPPTITSDHLVAGLTPVEQLLRVLGLAANADDSGDTADSVATQAERDIQMIADAEAFGYSAMRLDSGPFMTSAHRLYEAEGFRDRPAYVGAEVPAEVHHNWRFMERLLAPRRDDRAGRVR
jgi:hypothetical protein